MGRGPPGAWAFGGLLLLLAGAAAAEGPAAKPRPLTDDYVIKSFDLIALRSEYEPGASPPLRKWRLPVRVHLDIRVKVPAAEAALYRRLYREHLAKLAAITGHEIGLVASRAEANVAVVFERESRLEGVVRELVGPPARIMPILNSAACYASLKVAPDGAINGAVILIPPDRARSRGKLFSCIVEEITQVLGLPNDSDAVFPSIFNDRSVDQDLSELDRLLLQILYDPRMQPGMPRERALAVARTVLKDLRVSRAAAPKP